MCGIVGYIGNHLAIPITLKCLAALEYRGYDSAGLAYLDSGNMGVVKRVGKLENLNNFLKNKIIPASCAIGHTRWATHGKATVENAHPHTDANSVLSVVHNGIIENYDSIKKELKDKGIKFYSETDTEVFAKLLGYNLFSQNPDFNKYYAMHNSLRSTYKISKKHILKALNTTISQCNGTYAVAVLVKGYDDTIFFAKYKSPLILGKGQDENFLASDTPALLGVVSKFYSLKDGECGYIEKEKIVVCDENLKQTKPIFKKISVKPEQVMLGSFKHFMQKEIEQGAESVINTIDRIKKLGILERIPAQIFEKNFNLHITACGTALHAGMVAKYIIENQLRIPVFLDYASEFRYKEPLINAESICLFISQSGETADTLSCVELAKQKGATTIAFTNVPASRMESMVDYVIPTSAGPEIAVASTKAYLAQLGALYSLVDYVAKIRHITVNFNIDNVRLAALINAKFNYDETLNEIVELIKNEESIYFVGRGLDYILAMEAALKLKEVSYIHCEALPAGELKHGSLALIKRDCVVIAILTQDDLVEKMLNNIHEINSRGAKVILFSPYADLEKFVSAHVLTPQVDNMLEPFAVMKPLQILAYKTALARNLDPDKPRNLAKSVTVE